MFASKTETLVNFLNREKYRQRQVVCYKPKKDNRYSEEKIVSHNGTEIVSIPVANTKELFEDINHKHGKLSIGIDEIQFFDNDIVDTIWNLSWRGYKIFASGLNLDSFGKPFGPMPALLAYADKIVKLHAQCKVCGDNATMSYRKGSDKDTVFVGGLDAYEPRCKTHWKNDATC